MSMPNSFKILLIEPCEDFRAILVTLLELAGCEVRSISNSTTASTEAARFQPDMVLTELAGTGGFEIARQLKSIPQVTGADIVALTSFYWIGIEAEAMNAGFTHYLLKPATFNTLIHVVAGLAMLHGKKLNRVIVEPLETLLQ